MQTATRATVRTIAGQLAAIVGVVHLGMGTYYVVGADGAATTGDSRVFLWILVGAVLVGGVAAGAFGWRERTLYAVGAAVAASLVVAHLSWPLLAGGSLYLGPTPMVSLSDPVGYLENRLVDARPVATVVVATELALLVVLSALLRSPERL